MKLKFLPGLDYVKQDFNTCGYWEKRTTNYIRRNLKRGQTFLDIGSHVGYYTILAAQLGAKVIAVEPSKENRNILTKNIALNKCIGITVINKALSNFNGSAKLYKGKTPGEHSLQKNYHNSDGFELVNVTKYDDFNLGVPDFVKLDVEGNEKEVLEGMSSILKTKLPITLIIEDWDNTVTNWLIRTYGFGLVTTDKLSGNRILVKNKRFVFQEELMRYHVVGDVNAAKKLRKVGHYVIFYGKSGTKVECSVFVLASVKTVVCEVNKRVKKGDLLILPKGSHYNSFAKQLILK